MQFAYNNFISCQATRSSSYLFEFKIKKHDFLINVIIWFIDFILNEIIFALN